MRIRGFIGLLLLAAVLAVAGCGGGGGGIDNAKHGIPKTQAQALLTQLDQINSQVDRHNCGSASFQVRQLKTKVASLPSSVDSDLRKALADGVDHLDQLVADQCQRPTPTQTQTTPTPTETNTTPTQTQPPPTNTQPSPTTTQPSQTTPGTGGTPPNQGNANGNGTGAGLGEGGD